VASAAALQLIWRAAPGFLAAELTAWLREEEHRRAAAAAWPRMVQGFLARRAACQQ
jgi:hypothetical protein